jgi:hypothetical protein
LVILWCSLIIYGLTIHWPPDKHRCPRPLSASRHSVIEWMTIRIPWMASPQFPWRFAILLC